MAPVTLRKRYLDLMEAVLTGAFEEDAPIPTAGYRQLVSHVLTAIHGVEQEAPDDALGYNTTLRDKGWDWPSKSLTMVGRQRLHNFRTLIERSIAEGVAGDIIETGVWRGGASIMARAVLLAHDVTDRRVVVADSFEGLPPPAPDLYPADSTSDLHEFTELAIPLEQVQANFRRFDLLDDQVVFLKGWFRDTMPTVASERIAVLRLDGDMYESTMDALNALYDKVVPGGAVIVDDYGAVEGCRRAIADFLGARSIRVKLANIDGIGAWWVKSK